MKIFKEFLFGNKGNEYELVGMYNSFYLSHLLVAVLFLIICCDL